MIFQKTDQFCTEKNLLQDVGNKHKFRFKLVVRMFISSSSHIINIQTWSFQENCILFEYQRSRNSVCIHTWKLTYYLQKLACHLSYSRFKIGKLVLVIKPCLKVFKSFLCHTRLEFVHSVREPSSSLYQLESLQKNQVSQARAFLHPINFSFDTVLSVIQVDNYILLTFFPCQVLRAQAIHPSCIAFSGSITLVSQYIFHILMCLNLHSIGQSLF